jgi:hypothetical protein
MFGIVLLAHPVEVEAAALAQALRAAGFEVRRALSVSMALAVARSEPVAALVVAEPLGEVSAAALGERLAEVGCHAPMVVLGGFSDSSGAPRPSGRLVAAQLDRRGPAAALVEALKALLVPGPRPQPLLSQQLPPAGPPSARPPTLGPREPVSFGDASTAPSLRVGALTQVRAPTPPGGEPRWSSEGRLPTPPANLRATARPPTLPHGWAPAMPAPEDEDLHRRIREVTLEKLALERQLEQVRADAKRELEWREGEHRAALRVREGMVRNLELALEALTRDLAEAGQGLASQQDRVGSTEGQLRRAEQENEHLTSAVEAALASASQMRDEMRELRGSLLAAELEGQGARAQAERTQQSLALARAQVADLERALSGARLRAAEAEAGRAAAVEETERLRRRLVQLEAALEQDPARRASGQAR